MPATKRASGSAILGELPNITAWLDDDRYLEMREDPADQQRKTFVVSAADGTAAVYRDYAALGTDLSKGVDLRAAAATSADGNGFVLARDHDLHYFDLGSRKLRRLTSNAADEQNPRFSPDGKWIAYVEGTQLWNYGEVFVMPMGSDGSPRGAPRQVTTLGLTVVGLTWSRDSESVLFGAAFTMDTPRYLWRAWLDPKRQPERQNHIGFFPGSEAIEVFQKELLPYKTSKGTVQFPLDKPIPYPLVKKIVKYRVKIEAKRNSSAS